MTPLHGAHPKQTFNARRGEPPSSGERDKIVLAHPLQDQKYG
jgi:hypothetical protein